MCVSIIIINRIHSCLIRSRDPRRLASQAETIDSSILPQVVSPGWNGKRNSLWERINWRSSVSQKCLKRKKKFYCDAFDSETWNMEVICATKQSASLWHDLKKKKKRIKSQMFLKLLYLFQKFLIHLNIKNITIQILKKLSNIKTSLKTPPKEKKNAMRYHEIKDRI